MIYKYKEGKEKYSPNELGSLYVDTSKLNDNERPIIYIGGQMEHRLHTIENITSRTMDPGHNMFTANWFYEYPTHGVNKSDINAKNFANNFIEALKQAGLYGVDIITSSFGGLIGAYASQSELVHRIYAIHPPITGTPLANPKETLKRKYLLTGREKNLLRIAKLLVNNNYGFEGDSYHGVDLGEVDLNKLTVIGSSIDPDKEKGIVLDLYNIIGALTGLENDGVVVFDEDLFNKKGIPYIKEGTPTNHFNSCTPESLNHAYSLIRKRV